MRIRKGTKQDAESCMRIVKLDKATHLKAEDFKMCATDKNAVFFVAEETKVVGYILGFVVPTRHSEALIHETRVDKAFRGRGIGTALVEHFSSCMLSKGVKTVTAMIEPSLESFYIKSCGFKKVGNWVEAVKGVEIV